MCNLCDGSGWDWHPVMGWAACADCNDDVLKPKPDRPRKDGGEFTWLVDSSDVMRKKTNLKIVH